MSPARTVAQDRWTEYQPLDDLVPAVANPKRHSVATIVASLNRFGLTKPVAVVDERTGRMVAGHGRREALLELRGSGGKAPAGVRVDGDGVWWVPVSRGWRSRNDVEATAELLADNRTSEIGGWDLDELNAALETLGPTLLDGTGYTVDDLGGTPEPAPSLTDPDDAPDVPEAPLTVPGDVWVLGEHRLVCGDSTDPAVLAAVMDGGVGDLVFTDPPYGVAYVGKTADALTIENDRLAPTMLIELLVAAFTNTTSVCRPGATWFVTAPAGPLFVCFAQVLGDLGVWRQTLVWEKDTLVMGRSDYHYRHEALFYGWQPGAAHRPPPDRTGDTIWEFPRPKRSTEHPTMKPVALIEHAVTRHSDPGAVVVDPFAGSGSTLIAAHRTGRTARLVEVDPGYCDVICKRYVEHTGTVPVTVDGREYPSGR